jgi:hypothetical protein
MKTYKLIKPIGDYPLEDYIQIDDGNYAICIDGKRVILEKEIVENMPEYFVEVKEDWIDRVIKNSGKGAVARLFPKTP